MLTYFKPSAVVVVGIAGALDSELRLGDVAVAREVCQFQAASKVIDESGTFQFQYSGANWHLGARLDRMVTNFSIDGGEFYQSWLRSSGEFWRELGLPPNPLVSAEPRDVRGTIASGDTVGASKAFAIELLGLNRKLLALEMEAAGAVRACHDEGVDWLVIRGLSDFSDERKKQLDSTAGGAFRRLAARNAAEYLRQLLRWPDFRKAFNAPALPLRGESGGGAGRKAAEGSVLAEAGVLRPFRSVSLLQQLTKLLQAMKLPWSTLEEFFWKSIPETWQGDLMDESTPEAERYQHLVRVLAGFPQQASKGRSAPGEAWPRRKRCKS
jgi:nucleoside phosphorylase